jgi:hypothetical protein
MRTLVVLFLTAIGLPLGLGSSGAGEPPTMAPGPIASDYDGPAYFVPATPSPEHPNSSGRIRSGRQYHVRIRGDEAQVDLGSETVTASRRDFWVMPPFVSLADLEVDGVPLGRSGLRYHTVGPGQFDDPATEGYEGQPELTRRALACLTDDWSMGQQTSMADFIERGVHRRDRADVEAGVTALRWGTRTAFNGQAIHELTRSCAPGPLQDHGGTHHTTQFLEAMGRAVYLLAASPWAGEYRPVIDETIDRIELVASGLTSPGPWSEWTRHVREGDGNLWTHRTYMMAAGLGMASTLTDQPDDAQRWRDMAAWIAQVGIDEQRPDGVNPERGGHDLQYQVYGIWLAQLYLGTLDASAPNRDALEAAIDRAVSWELSRIASDGAIDIAGSTRVCAEILWWTDKASARLDPAQTIRVLLLQGMVNDRPDLIETASLVHHHEATVGNPCPGAESPITTTPALPPARPAAPDPGRGFTPPIGVLSVRRVGAAGVAALLTFALLTLAGRRRPIPGGRALGAVLVGASALVLLAE